jgi:hypothetical protein
MQYSTERIGAAVVDIAAMVRALCCKLVAKYSSHHPVYAMWTVVPHIYNVITAPHIKASIFNWTYLRLYWRYLDNSMRVILQSWCQIQRTSTSLRYLNSGPGHMQCNYSCAYSGFNIQVNVSALLLDIFRHFDVRSTADLVSNLAHIVQVTQRELWSRTYTM